MSPWNSCGNQHRLRPRGRVRVACGGLRSAELSALEAAGEVVEQRDHVVCVGLGLVEGGGQQGAGQGGLVDEDALGEPGQLHGALFIQGGVEVP